MWFTLEFFFWIKWKKKKKKKPQKKSLLIPFSMEFVIEMYTQFMLNMMLISDEWKCQNWNQSHNLNPTLQINLVGDHWRTG